MKRDIEEAKQEKIRIVEILNEYYPNTNDQEIIVIINTLNKQVKSLENNEEEEEIKLALDNTTEREGKLFFQLR